MVPAEKIVTAVQRGIANTRWRDFGDIWSLSRQHPISPDLLAQATYEDARHRGTTLRPLAEVLEGYAEIGTDRWARWCRRSNSDHLPEEFAQVLQAVIGFSDPVLTGGAATRAWDPEFGAWR